MRFGDLSELNDWQIFTTVDSRLELPLGDVDCRKIHPEQDVWDIWRQCMAAAGASMGYST